MSVQNFKTTDVLRLEVEADPTGLVNLIQNPGGTLGGWGWVTPLANSKMSSNSTSTFLDYAKTTSGTSNFTSEFLAITAGQYAAASVQQGASGNAYHRLRFEWYNSSKVLLSSSTQTALTAPSLTAVAYLGPIVAPASTAFMKLRVDLYTSGGADPISGNSFRFKNVTVAAAATSGALATVRTNLMPNPSFETNTTGWIGDTGYATISRSTATAYVGTACLLNTHTAAYGGDVFSGFIPITGSSTYTAQVQVKAVSATASQQVLIYWYNAGSTYLGDSAGSYATNSTSTWTLLSVTGTAPPSATQCRVVFHSAATNNTYLDAFMLEKSSTVGTYFDGATAASGGHIYTWTGTAHGSSSLDTVSNLSFIEPVPYINILGPTHEIKLSRAALDVGVLSATILDTALDPATTNYLRPGRRCRLRVYYGAGSTYQWRDIFTGRVSAANVSYDPMVTTEKRARIEITATDNVALLANQQRTDGVGSISDLPYVLEGCGVPWNVNGSGNQVASATIVSKNENASALDQVALTRDSNLGYAWVDRFGMLQAWSSPGIPYGEISDWFGLTDGTGTPADSYYRSPSGVDISYNTDDCINEVNVKFLRLNPSSGETEEIPYGPYRDEVSIAQWGVRSAEFTIHDTAEVAVDILAFALAILTTNATPEVTLNSVTIPIVDPDFDIPIAAISDLYSTVAEAEIGPTFYDLRVTSIEQTITPEKWLVTLGFGVNGSAAAPTWTPSPPQGGGAVEGVWITPTLTGSWVYYGSPFAVPQYMRKNGIVYLKGLVKNGTLASAMFTLPAGYRPAEQRIFSGVTSSMATGATVPVTLPAHTHTTLATTCRIDVTTAGVVGAAAANASNSFISLDGICFPAEA